jgi:hypothetical protein
MGLFGASLGAFIGLHLILFGGAAFLTGQAVASIWRPARQVVLYGLLLAAGARFLTWSLFGGVLLSPLGYVADAVLLIVIGLFAYRLTRVRMMVQQYPWLYRRKGPLSYAAIGGRPPE